MSYQIIVESTNVNNFFYRELLAQKGAFSELLIQYIQENRSEEDLSEIESQLDDEDLKEVFQRSLSSISAHK